MSSSYPYVHGLENNKNILSLLVVSFYDPQNELSKHRGMDLDEQPLFKERVGGETSKYARNALSYPNHMCQSALKKPGFVQKLQGGIGGISNGIPGMYELIHHVRYFTKNNRDLH